MLHRQPSSKDRARKSWEAILVLRYFEPANVVKESNLHKPRKSAHGHVAYAVQEVSKTVSKGDQNGTLCPGNERCGVVFSLCVRSSRACSSAWQIKLTR